MVLFHLSVILKNSCKMARTIKVDNAILKRRARKEQRRKVEIKKKRTFYLIVCEGEQTEPNYFNALKAQLPKGVLELTNIDIDGTGKNTLTIIKEAAKLREHYEKKYLREIDHVCAVFDRDSFPSTNFNNAVNKGENSVPPIRCAWTNEAFELWYLLHFNYYNTGISRDQYEKKLEEEIRKASGDGSYSYRKNDEAMFELLQTYGDQQNAIDNAKKLDALYMDHSFAMHNPCTKVYILIEELLALAEER